MKILIIFLIFLKSCIGIFDPITVGGLAGLAALGYNFETIKKLTYCRIYECCIEEHILLNVNVLKDKLKRNLFGQHIVLEVLIPALHGHFNQISKKPLVISFHGTPGTGKNYVADFIVEALYKRGLKSQYVYKILGRSDFPLESESNKYSAQLNIKIRSAISKCPKSLFIFDEVDKMPPGIFDTITSLLDHHGYLDGIDFRQAIFIFLSNTAGFEISKHLSNLMKNGIWRENTQSKDFEKILELGAYNLKGGLQKAGIIESHLIDHFIPFLPLEKEHIIKCIKAEYRRVGIFPSEERLNNIINKYVTFDEDSGLFATSGCKRLNKKVESDAYVGV